VSATQTCKVVLGLPTTDDELLDYAVDPRGRDLLGPHGTTQQKYTRQVMTPLGRVAPTWRDCGVKIYPGCTSKSLHAVVKDGPTDVLIIVSHWVDEPAACIELFDGMCGVDEIAAALPTDFSGIVDLCICSCAGLAKQVASRCPGAYVRWINSDATPAIWFHIYTSVFLEMFENGTDYLTALKVTLRRYDDDE